MLRILVALTLSNLVLISLAGAANVREYSARGPQPTVISPQGKIHKLYNESHALLINVSNYSSFPWRKLPATEIELNELASLMTTHGFHVTRILDPTGDELFSTIRNFTADYGRDPDNRLFIMFSGHGFTNPYNDMGYLVPADAPNPSQDKSAFYKKALSIKQLELVAAEVESRHALFVFDSCFSGTIFARRSPISAPEERGSSINERWKFLTGKAKEPVRQFIAAGGANEELPAKSVFIPLLVKALRGEGTKYQDGYITGKEIGLWIEQILPSINPKQNPHSDVIRDVAYIFGDMIFQVPALDSNSDGSGQAQNASSLDTKPGVVPEMLPKSVLSYTGDSKSTDVIEPVKWMWPAKGELAIKFAEEGSKGIVISGKTGQEIVAAADGKIVYVGNGLRGYGEMVIIKHNNLYLSAYYHNKKIVVREGATVKRGQKIAEMGNTDASMVGVGFEIRERGKPINPLAALPEI